MSGARDFDRWVCERLADWPSERILEFERWLLDEEQFELVAAVRTVRRQKTGAALRHGRSAFVPLTSASLAGTGAGEAG
jgi:hypothetical protein